MNTTESTNISSESETFYLKIRRSRKLALLVWLSRYLIGFAFIPSGMKKLLGLRFTQLGVDTPIGFFFEALYQSGMYWYLIGFGQVLAAFLLMTQRLATLGAVLFTFIIINIWAITVSLHFSGTWVITTLVMIGCFCLLLWDYNKLQFLFSRDNFSAEKNYVTLPVAGKIWEVNGLILFVLSVLYSIVGGLSADLKLQKIMGLGFVLLVLIIVIFTVIIDVGKRKIPGSHPG